MRRWWLWVLAAAVIACLATLLVSQQREPAATSRVTVESDATDGAAMKTVVGSARMELDAGVTYEKVAERFGQSADDLRARTVIAEEPDSLVLAITVTAPTFEQASAEADAIALAGVEAGQDRRRVQIAQLTEQSEELAQKSKLSDSVAERSRLDRLGYELGGNQVHYLTGSRQLAVLETAKPVQDGLSPGLAGILGLAAGGMVAVAAALFFGTRRGRLSSNSELGRLFPDIPTITLDDAANLARLRAPQLNAVVVGGSADGRVQLEEAADYLARSVAERGFPTQLTNSIASLEQHSEQLDFVPLPGNLGLARRVAADDGSVLVFVLVQPNTTRLQDLDARVDEWGEQQLYFVNAEQPALKAA